MKKIIILGCPGSGKSTLARALSEITGIPLYHLDNIWWNPDRTHVSRETFDERLAELISRDSWIIDGDYSRTYEVRIAAADTVIFLDVDLQQCLEGIRERAGHKRSDLPWIENEVDRDLTETVYSYREKKRPVVLSLLEKYRDKEILTFTSRSQINCWLKELQKRRNEMTDIFEYLQHNSYPGRGIIAGWHNGETVIAYFIMGRSANSRNRIFVKENGTLKTRAFDESKVADPSLIIYNAIRPFEDSTVVSNGDQTDTIVEYLEKGGSFEEALNSREYEPDAPNYTARISAMISKENLKMAILRHKNGECVRDYFDYSAEGNQAYFISTYKENGDPLSCFEGEPKKLTVDLEFEQFAERLWNSLDEDNKISLYVAFGSREIIYNKNEEH